LVGEIAYEVRSRRAMVHTQALAARSRRTAGDGELRFERRASRPQQDFAPIPIESQNPAHGLPYTNP
jgi:hypothetical protein